MTQTSLNPDPETPYANLTPDLILDAIDSVGFRSNGSLLGLNSYENRVYQIGIEDSAPLIAKFYRPHRWSNEAIIEEHQFSMELVEHEIPVIAPLVAANETLHHYQGYRFSLFPRQGGRPLELDKLEHLAWMGRFIGRLHAISACRPFQHRIQLNPQTYGYDAYHYLVEHHFIPPYLKDNYCQLVEILLEKISKNFEKTSNFQPIRLHGDCHAGNVLWNDAGPRIVDLDDCLMGPAIQDIWMLLSGNTNQMNSELNTVLDGYCEFYDYNHHELHLIESLRTLRMLHYSAWLAKRWNDPAFPQSFPWFNTPHYWQEQLLNLTEQNDLLHNEESDIIGMR